MPYFEFTDARERDLFVIRLEDPQKAAYARRILHGEETRRTHVGGLVVSERASYNARWSYHLDPASINFFEMAIEVCDALIRYVEEHLAEVGGAFLPGCRWCPWTPKLTREIPESEIARDQEP
jgi:hypothetical protein